MLGGASEANSKHSATATLVLILWNFILLFNKVSSTRCAFGGAQTQQKAPAHHRSYGFISLMITKFSKCLLLDISSASVLQLEVPSNWASLKLMMVWDGYNCRDLAEVEPWFVIIALSSRADHSGTYKYQSTKGKNSLKNLLISSSSMALVQAWPPCLPRTGSNRVFSIFMGICMKALNSSQKQSISLHNSPLLFHISTKKRWKYF